MGVIVKLSPADGASVTGYRADPAGAPRGGIVVCQEIFGVNNHIRAVADKFAAEGYLAIAPALFDRARSGVELGYDAAGIAEGREYMQKSSIDNALRDVEAAIKVMPSGLRVGVVGYCWGGTLAWASATRLQAVSCSVAYYGGGIGGLAEEKPRCPVLLHFGAKDQSIPADVVEKVRSRHPTVPLHVYDAGHGFNCDERASYDKSAAEAAYQRTIAFLRQHLG